MNIVLKEINRKFCFVYFDDVLIFSSSFDEHISHLETILKLFIENNIKPKIEKCLFAQFEITYLGHLISKEGIKPDPNRLSTVLKFKIPHSAKEVRQFLGLCSFFHRFICNFAYIAKPLHNLTKKTSSFKWKSECNKAFCKLKSLLTSLPNLVHYDPSSDLELRTDACDYAIGFVWIQRKNEKHGILAYLSRLLNHAEKNYSISKRECVFLIYSIKKLRHSLYAIRFTVITDHIALAFLKNVKDLNGRLARWSLA